MGFYIRKSIGVGPFKFNLSNSGLGVSVGVKGFRFGINPRGNYVHMGAHGIYYRATVPHSNNSYRNRPAASPVIPDGSHAPLEEIDSVDATLIEDSSSAGLLDEIREKNRKIRFWPLVLSFFCILTWVVYVGKFSSLSISIVFGIGVVLTVLAAYYDKLRKSVVLFYELESGIGQTYEILLQWINELSKCSKTWHVEAKGEVYDRKYHAGADHLVRRNLTAFQKKAPPYFLANIETYSIKVGKQTLYFFPDRVLIYDGANVGSVSYASLRIDVNNKRFIETDSLPSDARVIDYTWRYVNKSGGPDRRFKDNAQIPICLYEEIYFSSSSGLREVLQFSRVDLGGGFAEAIRCLAGQLNRFGN